MSGKTVRIDDASYSLLLKERTRHPGMSLSDIADLALQKTYGEENLMATDFLHEEFMKLLHAERESNKDLMNSKDEQIRLLKETLERERKLLDAATNLLEKLKVSKYEQTDTEKIKN